MTASRSIRRIFALLCLAVLLLVSLAPTGHGLPVAVLVPFWIVLAVLFPLSVRREDIVELAYAAPCFAVLPSRAPPAR